MNKEATLAAIAVMQAYVDGKTIEFTEKDVSDWEAFYADHPPSWDWDTYDYRIKQGPREYWLVAERGKSLRLLLKAPLEDWDEIIHVREIIE